MGKGATIIKTPFPSFAEAADKYGLSASERLDVQRAVDQIIPKISGPRSRKAPHGRVTRAKKK
jgi:hypothetical protein